MEEEDIKAWDFANKDPRDEEVLRQMAARHSTGGGASDPAAIGHHGHAAQFADVLDAIKTGRTPAIDGHEGRRSVEIILAIYQSAEIGRSVALPLTVDPALSSRQRDQIG